MLLIALFGIMGVGYGWAETYDGTTIYIKGMQEGACEISMPNSETKLDGDSTFQIGAFHGVNNVGTSYGSSRLMMCCYYEYPYTLPSYSKLVRRASFTIYHASNRHYHGLGLYVFDTEAGAKTTYLDATWDQNQQKPTGHLFSVAAMCVAGENVTSPDKDLVFDNRNGANDSTISNWFTFMHAVENGNPSTVSGQENGKWCMNTSLTDTWYYYKHVTFDGNGSTAGDMPKQIIENSAALTSNIFLRTGYKFIGWNTKADGSGDTYTDGQTITATATDKGEITLYAQWEEIDDAQGEEQYDGSKIYLLGWKSGSCNKVYNITFPYNGLGNFSWGTSTTETEGSTPFTFEQYHGIHNVGTSEGYARMMMCCYYVFPYMVPSYAKLVRKTNFTIAHSSNRHYHGLGLYLFDTEESATTTYLDATWDQNQPKPAGCILSVAATDNHQEEEVTSSDTTLVFDNQSGVNDSTLFTWFTFMHAVENGNPDPVSGQENGKWRMNQPTDTWYYYKHITFDGNGSTSGSMSKQTVENSAALTDNAFVRTGYDFVGWNTEADGSGDAYTDGQTITATETDKGEVTLYAQWATISTDTENLHIDMQEIRKLVEQGQVVIMNNGVKYDMKGSLY